MQTDNPVKNRPTSKQPPQDSLQNNSINATTPGEIKVIKRNGKMVSYDESKINF